VHVQKFLKKKRWFISLNPGTVLSVVCLRLTLNDHDQRLMAVGEVISQMKQRMAEEEEEEEEVEEEEEEEEEQQQQQQQQQQ